MALCHSMSAGSVDGTLKHCLMQNTLFERFALTGSRDAKTCASACARVWALVPSLVNEPSGSTLMVYVFFV